MGTTQATALPAFTESWVGGDIYGLQALADTLSGYVPKIADTIRPAELQVRSIVTTNGWQGTAAASFARAWARDEAMAAALSVFIGDAATIINELAVTLAGIENALEEAAYQANQAGVPVGSDGTLAPAELTPSQQQTAVAYQSFRQECLSDARKARTQAASALNSLYQQADPSSRNLDGGEWTSISDYLRGLLALPTSYRRYVEGKLPDVKKTAAAARAAAREETRGSDGRFRPWTDQGRQEFQDAKAKLQAIEDQASSAEKFEKLPSKLAGYGIADLANGSEKWGSAARFFGEIPFTGTGLAAVGAGFTIAGDRVSGDSWGHAVADGLTSNSASLVAGEGAGVLGAAGTATVAADFLGAGAAVAGVSGAVGGVLAGGVVAVGVGDFVHNVFQENWAADIHNHGVIAGIGHGVVDSLNHTGHDIAHLASGVWHAIF
ncbi:MAG TPA: hypothetical protein VF221_06545 [Chloroflexota bacterium]